MKLIRTILIISLISLLFLEVILRILATFPTDSPLFVNDPEIGYRMRPGSVIGNGDRTNRGGFNDREHSLESEPGVSRLAIIGDSFVFGVVSRELNFTHVLQTLVNRNGIALEILNMGIPAAEPNNYLALLKYDAVLMKVDRVGLIFFVGNDVVQSHPDFKTVAWLGSTRETLRRPYLLGPSLEYFYIYRTIRTLKRVLRERLDKTPRESFTRESFMEIEYRRSVIYQKDSRFAQQSYEGAIMILGNIAKTARDLGIDLFVVLAPDELQVNGELRDALAVKYGFDSAVYDFSAPQTILGKALRDSGVPVLDLLPAFQRESKIETLYATFDTHWNEAGNRLAAEVIWRFLNSGEAM